MRCHRFETAYDIRHPPLAGLNLLKCGHLKVWKGAPTVFWQSALSWAIVRQCLVWTRLWGEPEPELDHRVAFLSTNWYFNGQWAENSDKSLLEGSDGVVCTTKRSVYNRGCCNEGDLVMWRDFTNYPSCNYEGMMSKLWNDLQTRVYNYWHYCTDTFHTGLLTITFKNEQQIKTMKSRINYKGRP